MTSLPHDSTAGRPQRDDVTRRVHEAAASRQRTAELQRLVQENPQHAHVIDSLRGRAPIHTAIANNNEEALKILLRHGANSNHVMSRFDHYWRPLHFAASLGHTACLKVLLQYNADITARDESGYTPIQKATHHNHKDCKKILTQAEAHRRNMHAKNQLKIGEALQEAASDGDVRAFQQLKDEYEGKDKWKECFPSDGKTLLHRACENGRDAMVKDLLEKWQAFGQPCSKPPHKSPLHAACENGHGLIASWLVLKIPNIALLTTSDTESTALHLALRNVHEATALSMLKSAISTAKSSGYINLDDILTARNSVEEVPFHLAVQHGCLTVARVIVGVSAGDSYDGIAESFKDLCTPEVLSQQLEKHSACGYRPIHYACASENVETVKWLHSQHVDMMALTAENNRTPLQMAVRRNNIELVGTLLACQVKDGEGKALADAIEAGYTDIVHLLLLCGISEDQSELNRLADQHKKGMALRDIQAHGLPLKIEWNVHSLNELHISWLQLAQKYSKELSESASQLFDSPPTFCISNIDLSSNNLTSVPAELFQLPRLRNLNLSKNKITALPDLLDAPALTTLLLEWNELTRIPESFFAIPHLEVLNLGHNSISHLPPDMWFAPTLRALFAGHNKLQQLPVEFRSRCRRATAGRSMGSESDGSSNTKRTSAGRSMSPLSSDRIGIISEKEESGSHSSPMSPVFHSTNSSHGPHPLSSGSNNTSGTGSMEYRESDKSNGSSQSEASTSRDTPSSTPASSMRRPRRSIGTFGVARNWMDSSDEDEESDDEDDGDARSTRHVQSLKTLELNNNELTCLPEELPCLAPELSKLKLASNKIERINFPRGLPPLLKDLDLSGNCIRSFLASHDIQPYHCYRRNVGKKESSASLHSSNTPCRHRRIQVLHKLSTLSLKGNGLDALNILFPEAEEKTFTWIDKPSAVTQGVVGRGAKQQVQEEVEDIACPSVSTLDISENKLRDVPVCLSTLGSSLLFLNISNNVQICKLPNELGLLTDLFSLNYNGLSIVDPAPDFLEGKKVSEIVTFLRGRLKRSEPYRRLKLMMVGLQNKGKTTLLKTLRGRQVPPTVPDIIRSGSFFEEEGAGAARSTNDISTVGISLGLWECEPVGSFLSKKVEPKITFMTWDFGGQEEYYATHQYFISKRALYLLLWDTRELLDGIKQLHSWLVNIQARAPDSAVIIVGTHYDCLKGDQRRSKFLEQMKTEIKSMYGSGLGYPVIYDIAFVNATTDDRMMAKLRRTIYDVASSLDVSGDSRFRRLPRGYRTNVLDDQVPSSYLNLSRRVCTLAEQLRNSKRVPMLQGKAFTEKFLDHVDFDDKEELAVAVNFLHENGVLLHYDDPSLRDLYFLDPQWLCDMLAHIVTVKQVHSYIKNGILKVNDYHQIFKSSRFPFDLVTEYELLLAKFEVALRISDKELLVPSLLPDAKDAGCLDHEENKGNLYHRFVTLPYVPSGFWARLISRILSDKEIADIKERICRLRFESDGGAMPQEAEWVYWCTGVQLECPGSLLLLHVAECGEVNVLPILNNPSKTGNSRFFVDGSAAVADDTEPQQCQMFFKDNQWNVLNSNHSVRVCVLRAQHDDAEILCKETGHCLSSLCATLMAKVVGHVDALVEDWFHGVSQEAMKLTPCHSCVREEPLSEDPQVVASRKRETRNGARAVSSCLFLWEDLVWSTRQSSRGEELAVSCFRHGKQPLQVLAPDVVFGDLPPHKIIKPNDLTKSRKLGKGGFGAVFQGTLKMKQVVCTDSGVAGYTTKTVNVAIKSLLADSIGERMLRRESGLAEDTEEPQKQQQEMDPTHVALAYQNTRKELAVMCSLCHPHIIPFYGVCLYPLCFVLQLAAGELGHKLMQYHEVGQTLSFSAAWASALQIASGVDYLHSLGVVFCDLKAENVLAFEFPTPFQDERGTFRPALHSLQSGGSADYFRHILTKEQLESESAPVCGVRLKIADFGISRSGGTVRGYAGTIGFMSPEVLQYHGRESYSDKTDIFSYAMTLYEIITLHRPMPNATETEIKRAYLNGNRPHLSRKHLQSSIMLRELMHWCWQQQPEERPSARQVIDALTEPAHTRLLHGFVVTDELAFTACHSRLATVIPASTPSGGVGGATVGTDTPSSPLTSVQEEGGSAPKKADKPEGKPGPMASGGLSENRKPVPDVNTELWLCSGDNHTGVVKVLNYSGHNSEPKDVLTVSCSVTAIISVRDIVWLGMQDGSIIFVDAAQHVVIARDWISQKRLPILCMLHVAELNRVYVAHDNGVVIAYKDEPQFLPSEPAFVPLNNPWSRNVSAKSNKSIVGSVYLSQERLKEEKKKKKEKKPVVGAEYGNEDFSGDSVSRPVSNATTLVGSDRLSFTSTDTQGTLTSDDNDKSASTPSVQLEEVQRYTSRQDVIACMIAVPALRGDNDFPDPMDVNTMTSFDSLPARTATPPSVRSQSSASSLRSPFTKSGSTCTSPVQANESEDENDTDGPAPAKSRTLPREVSLSPHMELEADRQRTDGSIMSGDAIDRTDPRAYTMLQKSNVKGGNDSKDSPSRVQLRPKPSPAAYSQKKKGCGLEIWCGHSNGRVAILDATTLRQTGEICIQSMQQRTTGHMAHLVVSNLSCSTVSRVARLQTSRRVDLRLSGSQECPSPKMQRRSPSSSPSTGAARQRVSTMSNPQDVRTAANKVARRGVSMLDNNVIITKSRRSSASSNSSGATSTPGGTPGRNPDSACSSPSLSENCRHGVDLDSASDVDDIPADSERQLVQTVWGSVRHNPHVYCWDVKTLAVVAQIDCYALLGLGKKYEGQAWVSSLLCHEQELYIGTRGGHIIVMDLSKEESPPPFHAFYRHHMERICAFLPVLQPCAPVKKQRTSSMSMRKDSADSKTPASRRPLVASCGGGFYGYVEDEQLKHLQKDLDGHVLVWETGWSKDAAGQC